MDWLKPTEEVRRHQFLSFHLCNSSMALDNSKWKFSPRPSELTKTNTSRFRGNLLHSLRWWTYSIVNIATILVMIMIYHDLHCECKWFWLFKLSWLSYIHIMTNLSGWVTTSCNLNSSPFRRVPWRMGLMCLSKPSTMERSSVGWFKIKRICCFSQGIMEEFHRNVVVLGNYWSFMKSCRSLTKSQPDVAGKHQGNAAQVACYLCNCQELSGSWWITLVNCHVFSLHLFF